MRPIQREEVLGLVDYEQIRARFRARVIEAKKARRCALSDIMSVRFEDRDSVLLQIQEMLRTERISDERGIKHEIETYNELVPGAHQLSLTLFIEIANPEQREQRLTALAGLERSVAVEIAGKRYPAEGEDRSVEGITRTTALHYLKVNLDDDAVRALKTGSVPVSVVIDHPEHATVTPMPAALLRSVAHDFDGGGG